MNNPGGCPDLGIIIGVDVVHQEIDQPAFLLEHRQEVDDFGVRAARFRLSLRGSGRFGRRLRRDHVRTPLQEQPDQNQDRKPQGGS
jgi:hypothetical protein